MNSFSHLLLVMNSSMNIIFYGVFNQQFRLTAQKVFLEKFGFCRTDNLHSECGKRGIGTKKGDDCEGKDIETAV